MTKAWEDRLFYVLVTLIGTSIVPGRNSSVGTVLLGAALILALAVLPSMWRAGRR
jgi:hypothetical protein